MCPACLANAAAVVAGAGSTGGILVVLAGRFRKFFNTNRLGMFSKPKGAIGWQQARKESRNAGKG